MTENGIFTPIEGDTFAAPRTLIEVATVKPSGYLNHRGIVPAEYVDTLADSIKAYYAQQGRQEPVVYVRAVGATVWTAREVTELHIPDTLPDEFQ